MPMPVFLRLHSPFCQGIFPEAKETALSSAVLKAIVSQKLKGLTMNVVCQRAKARRTLSAAAHQVYLPVNAMDLLHQVLREKRKQKQPAER